MQSIRFSISMQHSLKAGAAITNKVPKRNIEKGFNENSHWFARRSLSSLVSKNRLT